MTRGMDGHGRAPAPGRRAGGPRRWRWGNVPVPEAHLGVGIAALALHGLWPRRIAWEPLRWLGWPLVLGGVALGAWATRAAGATDLARPDALVTEGPYALSRHPMYVAWTAILVGIALLTRSAWLARLTPVLAVLVHREAEREEQRLTAAFGAEYRAYQARVRRYL